MTRAAPAADGERREGHRGRRARADRDALGVHAVAVDVERRSRDWRRAGGVVHDARRGASPARPSAPACCANVSADHRGVGRGRLGHRHGRQRHAGGQLARPAPRSQPDFWKSEMSTISRRGRPATTRAGPAAARSAGPKRVSPAPGCARSIAATSARAVRRRIARRPRRRRRRTRPCRRRRAPRPRTTPARGLLRPRPVAAVAHAARIGRAARRPRARRPARRRRAAGRQERPREGERDAARTPGCAAPAAASGGWRGAARTGSGSGAGTSATGTPTTVRRSRCTRCTTIGIAMREQAGEQRGGQERHQRARLRRSRADR